jgi:hypothetical protein
LGGRGLADGGVIAGERYSREKSGEEGARAASPYQTMPRASPGEV